MVRTSGIAADLLRAVDRRCNGYSVVVALGGPRHRLSKQLVGSDEMTNELNVRAVAVGAILSQATTVTRTALNPTGGQLVLRDSSGRYAKIANTVRVTDREFLEDVLSEWWRTKIATSQTDSGIRPFQMEQRHQIGVDGRDAAYQRAPP
ncbi:hypothetical protein ABIF69_007600 [Bradyrhizobium japonicum]